MFHEFPYTNFSEMNLDWLICACKKNEGLHLAIVGDTLRLLNKDNEVISNVTISYAEKALTDVDGRNIKAYLISAGVAGDTLVFTSGDQVITTITVPYAEKSKYDIYHNELTDYVLNVQAVGNKIRITKGDTTVTEFDCPFALQAASDTDGNAIQTYACDLTVDGNLIQLRDRAGRVLSGITVPFAVNATNAVNAQNAAEATHALDADEADHATEADSADYALLSTDATNAVESVAISGDNVIFTTYGGVQTTIQSPFSVKAQKDDLGNVIKTTYVASVSANAGTGEISFLDALGNVITTITPQVEIAKKDTYGNLIADYIKSILVDSNSNYVSVVHGTGTTDSILINYSTHALNDINDQAIHNTYITYLECVEDVNDGHYKIVAYDGDTPKAELFRFDVIAYSAQTDINGKALTSYVADVDINANKEVVVKNGEGNTLNTFDTIKNAIYAEKDVNNHSITGYVKYIDTNTSDTLLRVHDGDNNVYTISAPSVQVTVTSTVAPSSFNNTNFSSSAVSCNYDDFSVLNGIGDTATVIVRYSGNDYFARVKTQDQSGVNNKTIFEAELTSGGLWQIELVTTTSGAFVSCTGKYVTVSGGGGGSSITILGLYDPNQGSLMSIDNVTQNQTVEVWDITDMANPVPLDDTAFLAKIQAGPCYFKDSRYNTYSVMYDATANRIGVTFNSVEQPIFIAIGFQWSTNWNIAAKKSYNLSNI